MKKQKKSLVKVCYDCDGEGYVSSCCHMQCDGRRCVGCGKFSKLDFCCEGFEEYKVGDEIYMFVGVYSDEKLKKALYEPKEYGDSKMFYGKITKIINDWTVEVKIKYRNKFLKVDIDDIEIN